MQKELKTVTHTRCRQCSGNLYQLYSFGKLYVSTFVTKEQIEAGDEGVKAPLVLVECVMCKLVQLRHTAPMELMYQRHYWYRSGINKMIKEDLQDIALRAIEMGQLKPGDLFIDLGANDGTLLSYVPKSIERIGVEPALNLVDELKKHCTRVVTDFWGEVGSLRTYGLTCKARAITAIGMFYDLESPNHFIRDVKKHLHEDGVFIAQLMTMRPMIELNDLGNICHEHLEYYSYNNLVKLFEDNGLEIFKVTENKINGGSYRLYAQHYKTGSVPYEEPSFDVDDFARSVNANRMQVITFVREQVAQGKKVYGYGASTKFNTILQYYGLTNKDLIGIADASPEKVGKYTVGTHIPIVSEDEARENADYFLVGPYGFKDVFIEREQEWLQRGGKFISHTPKFSVYGI